MKVGVGNNLRGYVIDTALTWFWSWLLLTPFAFILWGYTLDIWVSWTISGIPVFFIIGKPWLWLVDKCRRRLGLR